MRLITGSFTTVVCACGCGGRVPRYFRRSRALYASPACRARVLDARESAARRNKRYPLRYRECLACGRPFVTRHRKRAWCRDACGSSVRKLAFVTLRRHPDRAPPAA